MRRTTIFRSEAGCRYCGEPWNVGGEHHKPDCFIRTGIAPPVLGRKKPRKYQSVEQLPEELPRVEPMKGFEKP